MSEKIPVYTDPAEAKEKLGLFLQNSCTDKLFVFESPDPNPVKNCLCWHEYSTLGGILYASLRYTILVAAYKLPFSEPKRLALKLFGAKIHKGVYFSPRVFVDPLFPSLLTVEEGVLIGVGAGIALHEHGGARFSAGRVIIRRGATIGAEAKIGCGVEIGEYSIVGLGAVVLRDVPPRTIVLGNPARVVRAMLDKNLSKI